MIRCNCTCEVDGKLHACMLQVGHLGKCRMVPMEQEKKRIRKSIDPNKTERIKKDRVWTNICRGKGTREHQFILAKVKEHPMFPYLKITKIWADVYVTPPRKILAIRQASTDALMRIYSMMEQMLFILERERISNDSTDSAPSLQGLGTPETTSQGK